mgnify:CR=1 FL=1
MPSRSFWPFLVLFVLGLVLFLVHLSTGSVALSFTEIQDGLMGSGDSAKNVVRLVRLPQALTALLAGAGLAASGLLMQTLFLSLIHISEPTRPY